VTTPLDDKALEAAYQDFQTVTGEHLDEHVQEAIQDAIRAYMAALDPAPGWQTDMENAPNEGEFLLFDPVHGINIGVRWPLRGGFDIGVYFEDDPEAEEHRARGYTHWRHLPTPPEEA